MAKGLVSAFDGVASDAQEAMRKAWIRKAIELQIQALIRSRNKEIMGSEIYALRTREVAQLQEIMEDFK